MYSLNGAFLPALLLFLSPLQQTCLDIDPVNTCSVYFLDSKITSTSEKENKPRFGKFSGNLNI